MTKQHKADLQDLLDLVNRIEQHADQVYVRDTIGGTKYVTCLLTELPVEYALVHISKWLRDNINRKLEKSKIDLPNEEKAKAESSEPSPEGHS
jgi:hypothetical protein